MEITWVRFGVLTRRFIKTTTLWIRLLNKYGQLIEQEQPWFQQGCFLFLWMLWSWLLFVPLVRKNGKWFMKRMMMSGTWSEGCRDPSCSCARQAPDRGEGGLFLSACSCGHVMAVFWKDNNFTEHLKDVADKLQKEKQTKRKYKKDK